MSTYRSSLQQICNRCGRMQRSAPIVVPEGNKSVAAEDPEGRQISPISPLSPSPLSLNGSSRFPTQAEILSGPLPRGTRDSNTTMMRRPDNWPLVEEPLRSSDAADHAQKQSRSLALRTAILRPFSRQRTQRASVIPFVPKKHAGLGDFNPSKIMTKISNTIRRKNTVRPRTADDALLHRSDSKSRFSFMDRPNEEDAFEMNDVHNTPDDGPYHAATIPEITILADTGDLQVSQSETKVIDVGNAMASKISLAEPLTSVAEHHDGSGEQQSLSAPRPGVSRFKSMRESAGRAAAVTRTTSIRRLNSVKKAPSLWYRDDMALEGAIGVY